MADKDKHRSSEKKTAQNEAKQTAREQGNDGNDSGDSGGSGQQHSGIGSK